jgi:hypothetical protein
MLVLALPVNAQLWDSLTNPKVTVTINHPPGLGLNVKKIAFAPISNASNCADQLLDMVGSDFVASGAEVIDRQNLEAMLAEHKFNLTEYVDPAAKARLGKMLGPAALVFVKVTRCAPEQKSLKGEVWKDRNGNYHRDFMSRTSVYLKGSVRTVDLTTGRTLAAVPIDETVTRENKSRDECCPEFPSEFDVQDEAMQRGVLQAHRMFFPWSETRPLYFFDDVPCGLQTAFRMLKAGDHEGTLRQSLDNAQNCVAGPKVKEKVVWHAQYNAGLAHFILGEHAKALEYLNKAAAGGGGTIVTESAAECRRALQLAEAMRRVDERPPLDVAEPTAVASPAKTAAALTPTDDLETRLKKLKTMYDKGLITKDDYEKKKAELLKSF